MVRNRYHRAAEGEKIEVACNRIWILDTINFFAQDWCVEVMRLLMATSCVPISRIMPLHYAAKNGYIDIARLLVDGFVKSNDDGWGNVEKVCNMEGERMR